MVDRVHSYMEGLCWRRGHTILQSSKIICDNLSTNSQLSVGREEPCMPFYFLDMKINIKQLTFSNTITTHYLLSVAHCIVPVATRLGRWLEFISLSSELHSDLGLIGTIFYSTEHD